jgi:hypothetical protein
MSLTFSTQQLTAGALQPSAFQDSTLLPHRCRMQELRCLLAEAVSDVMCDDAVFIKL